MRHEMSEANGHLQLTAEDLDARRRPLASRLLTAEELAERWQVSAAHVYRLTRAGAIPAVRLGRYYRYRAAAIDTFEEGGGCDGETRSE
jgi:excisionase family DNA binding protein